MTVTEEFRAARDRLLALRGDYDGARSEFQWPRFEEFNFALDWFDQLAADPAKADKPALVIVEQDGSATRRSFADLSRRSSQVANWLRGAGRAARGPDDHHARQPGGALGTDAGRHQAGHRHDSHHHPDGTGRPPGPGGARRCGLGRRRQCQHREVRRRRRPVHADRSRRAAPRDPAAAQANALQYYGADAAAAGADFTPDAPTPADETLLLYFTSGTTSKAKLVEHTHTSYPVGHLSTMFWIGMEPGDVHLNVASPGWAKHAWSNVFTPWIAEACVFIYNYERFDARALMEQMDRESVTSFCAPPTVWRMLIQADLTLLKNPPTKVVSAGEPLNAEVIDQVHRAWGQTIRDGFGQTESTVQIANTPGQPIKIGAMGKPLPGYDVVLVDPATGEEADDGELCLRLDPRPVGLMKAYYGDPDKTAEAFRDGYYHTGDMASRDERGIITYVGRGDDVFKSSDYRLSPFELESVLIEHPAVAEAAVVPSPDPLKLSVPKAFVVLAAGHQPGPELAEDILRYCREHLAPFKRIRRLEFAELPKTISGKIRRVELRHSEEVRHGGGPVPEGFGIEYSDSDFPGLKGQG